MPPAPIEILGIALRNTGRDGRRPDAHFTASIGKHVVPNARHPLTATAVAVLTSAYVHRNRVPVLELTPVWTIGEHRPRRRTPDPSCGVRSRPRYRCIEIGG